MLFLKKIKASALQMVLVIAVIIIILLFAFISFIYLKNKIAIKHANYSESVYDNHQIFEYLKKTKIPFGKTDSIQLFSNKTTASVTKKQWGIFDLVHVKTKTNKEVFNQSALLGENNIKRKALYLKNNNQQLILVGNTTVKGNVAIPERGVNSGNIAGVSYNKDRLIYGEKEQSNTKLPSITNKENIRAFLSSYAIDSITFFDLEETSFLRNSFSKRTVIHQKNGVIDIVNSKLIGNIILVSDTLIKVHASTKLEDVILIAPTIEIESGFKGNLQAFATHNIKLKEYTELHYPSALILFENSNTNIKQISLAKNTTVKGVISFFSTSKKSNFNSQLFLDTKSVVKGDVYCEGNFELKGEVHGSVYTNSFIVKQSGSIYINHIYNGIINSEKLPKQFSGLQFSNSFKSVAKWVQ